MTTDSPTLRVALLVGIVTLAAVPGYSDKARVDCREGGRTQLEMNTCAGQKAAAAGERLNALLAELDGALGPKARQDLASIQKSWVTLRDRDCKWEGDLFEGGAVAPLVYATCIATRTEERIQRLKVFLCEGAGMTGPCEASRKY